MAYYEPFHECLNSLSNQLPRRLGSGDWNSGHPDVKDYWHEYRAMKIIPALLGQSEPGIFNKKEYFDFTPSKQKQITYLIDRALEEGHSTICLCFTRSLGSSLNIRESIRAIYPHSRQTHVLLRRDPLDQVSSNIRIFMAGQPQFLLYYIIALSDKYPILSNLIGMDLSLIREKSFLDACRVVSPALLRAMKEQRYPAIFNLAVKSYLACTMLQLAKESNHFDMVVDVGNFTSATEFRDKLINDSGISLDLTDYSSSKPNPAIKKDVFTRIAQYVRKSLGSHGLSINSEVFFDYYRNYI